MGDGRLTLEGEAPQQFDILVMDAFSGDSVPVHLITLEAFKTYFRHLKPGGILAVNISNKYLNLAPVMAAAASRFHKVALRVYDEPMNDEPLCFVSGWVAFIDPSPREKMPLLWSAGDRLEDSPSFRPWTDDDSNMFRILR